MKALHSKQGQQLLHSLGFTDALYAFDFDGTLAPIVQSPESAGMAAQVEKLLIELSQQAKVAVISGRSIADLQARISGKNIILIGNHGIEGLGMRKPGLDRAKEITEGWVDTLESRGKSLWKSDPGCFIENKTYTLALHYRLSRNKRAARSQLLQLGAGLEPSPRVILGKSVINLIPPGGPHKGVALLEAMMKLNVKSALYVGDDDTDEDVFGLPDSGVITVRVGKKHSSAAQFYLNRQSEMRRLLQVLIRSKKGL